MATDRLELNKDILAGGINDSRIPSMLAPNQAQTQENWAIWKDLSLRKVNGRLSINTGYASNITGQFMPPGDIKLVEITTDNQDIYIVYDTTSNTTIHLAAGTYHTYAELAAEMQTRMQADGDLGTPTVTYNTTTKKFDIVNVDAGYTIVVCWFLEETTIDKALFGFVSSVSIANTATGSSEFKVDSEPPYKRVFTTTAKMYDEDKAEVTLPDGSSIESSSLKAAGIQHNDRLYFSNGKKTYVKRDKYIREQIPTECPASPVLTGIAGTSTQNHEAETVKTDTLQLSSSVTEARILISPSNPNIYLVDTLLTTLHWATNTDFKVNIYAEIPAINYRLLIKSFQAGELVAGTSDQTITEQWVLPSISEKVYLLIQYEGLRDNATGTLGIYGDDPAPGPPASNTEVIDADGVFGDADFVSRIGITTTEIAGTASALVKSKFSMENAEGYESALTPDFANGIVFGANDLVTSTCVIPDSNIDYKWLNVYRTKEHTAADINPTYYLVAKIHKYFVENSPGVAVGIATLYAGLTDDVLAANSEADVTTQRTSEFLYKNRAIWWENRMWVIDAIDPRILRWTNITAIGPQPEATNPQTQFNLFGREGTPLISIVGMEGRMVVFKENSFYLVQPNEETFDFLAKNEDGVGTRGPRASVGTLARRGPMVYFQTEEGHFAATNGVGLDRLSQGNERDPAWRKGRLDYFVNNVLNKDALEATEAFYLPGDNIVGWSVATGSSTVPDTTIIYSITHDAFWIDSANVAELWAYDTINPTYPGETVLHGAATTQTFYGYKDDQDLGANIVCSTKRANWHLGDPSTSKFLWGLILDALAETANQEIDVSWYINRAAAAHDSVTHILTKANQRLEQPLGGVGWEVALQIDNDDGAGWVQFGLERIDYQSQEAYI